MMMAGGAAIERNLARSCVVYILLDGCSRYLQEHHQQDRADSLLFSTSQADGVIVGALLNASISFCTCLE
jgi:hypothetical protein